MLEKHWTFTTAALLASLTTMAHGQVFSDSDGTASLYTVAGDGPPDPGATPTIEDVRFGFDYGNFDLFNNSLYETAAGVQLDGFLKGSIAEAPNSAAGDAATTGLFISANNSSFVNTSLFAGVYANGVDVGAGTSTPDYVLKFDSFMSSTNGVDGAFPSGATNYFAAGINYDPSQVVAEDFGPYTNARSNSNGGQSGQTLAYTTDRDGFDDYEVTIGNVTIEDRSEGFTGLATAHIEQGFIDAGFSNTDYVTPIETSNADDGHATPIVGNEAIFDATDATTVAATSRQFWREQFPETTDPLHFSSDLDPRTLNPNDSFAGGTPYNRWVENEIYYVDGVWTYVIDDTVVLQVDPDEAGDGTQTVTDSGTIGFFFFDGFSSFSSTPEGTQFAIVDNIVVEAAASGDAPDMTQFLIDEGYIPEPAVVALLGDYNGNGEVDAADYTIWADNFNSTTNLAADGNNDGVVDAADYTIWADNFGNVAAAAFPVPEPSTALVLAGLGLIAARRRRQA
ncbi:MAG: PEP-CTERM sorting domain-containing protein [Planctomycetota bacterium]